MKDIYAWVPWFEELARKIDEGGEAYLVECAKRVNWVQDDPALLKYGDEFIDPFSFIYFLAQRCTTNRWRFVCTSVDDVFGIDKTNHRDFFSENIRWHSFHQPTANVPALFHDRQNAKSDLFWRLFRQARKGGRLVPADFKAALDIKGVGVSKLTGCLFLINPNHFMPADGSSTQFYVDLGLPSFQDAKIEIEQENGFEEYRKILDRFRAIFPQCAFYEISIALYVLWQRKKGNPVKVDEEFFRASMNPEKDIREAALELIQHLRGEDYDYVAEETSLNQYEPAEEKQMTHPLNQILFGPPGTGKTYNTVNYALAIIEGRQVEDLEREKRARVMERFGQLKDSGQISMVTFHQSFSYEDFIEGIRPVLEDDSDSVKYEIVDGIFKQIANRAQENLAGASQEVETFDLNALLQDFAQHINEKSSRDEPIKLHEDPRYSHRIMSAETSSRGEVRFALRSDRMENDLKVSSRVIQQKYREFLDGKIESYRDIKPTYESKSSYHGQAIYIWDLMRIMKTYQNHEWQPVKKSVQKRQNYVLIIDEINRGNIAKIFGELITLIEPIKRLAGADAATVTLPYSKGQDGPFGVPDNLYIIGTMNTADRSIALLDTALRRRFEFVEMMPQPNHPDISADIDGVNCRELLAVINKRICVLLDREHQIGHSYLIGVSDMTELARVFQHRIIPLLQEYFYDDWEQIRKVLNKNAFIRAHKPDENLFDSAETADPDHLLYELLDAKDAGWMAPGNYRKIYAKTQTQPDEGDE